jgi:catechol 2,3-dioxygenase-like lactoylglutathione lyase family enzyme
MSPLVSGVDFVQLPTRDIAEASRFYGDVLGLECSARYGRVPGAEFETGTLTLQLFEIERIGMAFNVAHNPVALHVDDVAAARSELEGRGVQFVGDTIDSGVCHMAIFRDPDGNTLMLHHRYAPKD